MVRLCIALGLILMGTACSPTQPRKQGVGTAKNPAQVSMALHITTVHGICIGTNETADIRVAETNNQIAVCFTSNALARIDPTCLSVMQFSGPEKRFTKRDYLAFLDQLHTFFMVTHVKAKATQ